MKPELIFADEVAVLPACNTYDFAIRRSPGAASYHELLLQDTQGRSAHWIISQPIKQLARRPMLLWLLSAKPLPDSLACVEAGTVQLVPAHPGIQSDLRADLDEGLLRLQFTGQLLHGYYRLQCLAEGDGQLWQLIPISRV
jgi:hypothetical protein